MLFDKTGKRKYINVLERKRFYKQALKIEQQNERNFCLVLYFTGCRISEALHLTSQSIDLLEKTIVFRTLKQRGNIVYRAIPVPEHFLLELHKQYSDRPDDATLWGFSRTTGWKIIKLCMSKAGVTGTKSSPKGLRHGFAIAAIINKIPLPVLQKWMGHSKMDTTAHYLAFVGKDERNFAKLLWPTK